MSRPRILLILFKQRRASFRSKRLLARSRQLGPRAIGQMTRRQHQTRAGRGRARVLAFALAPSPSGSDLPVDLELELELEPEPVAGPEPNPSTSSLPRTSSPAGSQKSFLSKLVRKSKSFLSKLAIKSENFLGNLAGRLKFWRRTSESASGCLTPGVLRMRPRGCSICRALWVKTEMYLPLQVPPSNDPSQKLSDLIFISFHFLTPGPHTWSC
jgi:hypothetical protein